MNVDLAQVGPAQSPILCFHFIADGTIFSSNERKYKQKKPICRLFRGKMCSRITIAESSEREKGNLENAFRTDFC